MAATATIRGEFTINGRSFAVCATDFCEMKSDGTKIVWGTVVNDFRMCTFASSPQQLLISSAGFAYVFNLQTGAFTQIPAATFDGAVSMVGYCDGFFIVLIANSEEFYVSAPLNAFDWTTNGNTIVSVFPDNVVSMLVDHREIWLWSPTRATVYYDSGNIFPFDVVPGGYIEAGCGAQFSPVKIGNTIIWLGADDRGANVFWRAQGYTPARVSDHALEYALSSYKKTSDCIAFAYQYEGHDFYVAYFPTADKTWVLDLSTMRWHQRGFWNEAAGFFTAARYQCHTYNPVWNKHLVGDWRTGLVYEMKNPVLVNGAWQFCDDNGSPIRRERTSPHVTNEQKWIFHDVLQLYVEAGLGPQPPLEDGDGNPRDPQVWLSWSDDGGHTWSNEYSRGIGQTGNYRKRVRWTRLGRSRDRVYKIAYSDPVPLYIGDAYLNPEPGDGT